MQIQCKYLIWSYFFIFTENVIWCFHWVYSACPNVENVGFTTLLMMCANIKNICKFAIGKFDIIQILRKYHICAIFNHA